MACFDPLCQGFAKGLDRVALVQRAERRCDLQRALGDFVDGMAPRAVVNRKGFAALLGWRGRLCLRRHNKAGRNEPQKLSHHYLFWISRRSILSSSYVEETRTCIDADQSAKL